jgi:5-methyltetrahydropteroyltriglutamate--homocysteine methyltransferase
MTLRTSTTGSWPPTFDPEKGIRDLSDDEQDIVVQESIERSIRDQIELKIDVLVDGQVRDDMVSILAAWIPGYDGNTLPYYAVGPIRPSEKPITVHDYLYAKKSAGNQPLKAHITGPMTMARATIVHPDAGYASRNDPKLIYDLAKALGQEARFLVQAGAEVIQIDEPVLADGIDIDLAFEALREIIEIGEIPFPALHACGNLTRILDDILTRSPIKMVSIEGSWLKYDELNHIDKNYLTECGKQIGLGCIQVNDYRIDRLTVVQNFLDQMVLKLGEENIWAVMPNCGLRHVPREIVIRKLKVMTEAVKSL